jgi:hypothetical protein
MDDSASQRAAWQPGRRARRPAWQALTADVIEVHVWRCRASRSGSRCSLKSALSNDCGGCGPALVGARVARVPTCCLPEPGIANAE